MAIRTREMTPSSPHGWSPLSDVQVLAPIMRLVSGIWSLDSVRRVGLAAGAGQIDLWVIAADEAPEDEARIYELEREYLQSDGVLPIEVNFVPLSRVDEDSLPPIETIFER